MCDDDVRRTREIWSPDGAKIAESAVSWMLQQWSNLYEMTWSYDEWSCAQLLIHHSAADKMCSPFLNTAPVRVHTAAAAAAMMMMMMAECCCCFHNRTRNFSLLIFASTCIVTLVPVTDAGEGRNDSLLKGICALDMRYSHCVCVTVNFIVISTAVCHR